MENCSRGYVGRSGKLYYSHCLPAAKGSSDLIVDMIKVLVAASAVVFRKTVAEVQRDANRESERDRKQKQKAREKKTTEKQFQTENERDFEREFCM